MHLATDGRSLEERYITGQSLMYFASQPAGENYCGLSVGKVGQYTAVGFDALGSVTWEYPLPPGEYVQQLPRVQSIRLTSGDGTNDEPSRGWLVAAANGSLHWLSEQGELVDRFDCGDILTGVTMWSVDDSTRLFVATTENLSAWHVRRPPPAPKEETRSRGEASTAQPTESALESAAEESAPAKPATIEAEPAEPEESTKSGAAESTAT